MVTSDIDRGIDNLDVHNYPTWEFKIRNVLVAKGLGSYITTPLATDADAATKEKDGKALSQINLHVKDHHIPTLIKCTTAKQAWDALAAIYKSKSQARQLQLRRDLNAVKKGDDEPCTKYVNRVKTLWHELTAIGYEMKEAEVVWTMLAGLPANDYGIIRQFLELSDTPPELDSTLAKLLNVEARLTTHGNETKAFVAHDKYGGIDPDEAVAFYALHHGRGTGRGGRGGGFAGGRGMGRGFNRPFNSDKQCTYCNFQGVESRRSAA